MSVTGEPGGAAGEGRRAADRSRRRPVRARRHPRGARSIAHRTGVGQQIDTSLVDAGVALSVWEATEYFAGHRRAARRWDRRTA